MTGEAAENYGIKRHAVYLRCLEVYGEGKVEYIKDLLTGTKLDGRLYEDDKKKKEIQVVGATKQPIKNLAQAMYLLELSSKHRRVAGTDMNLHSSRSHMILTVFVNLWTSEGKVRKAKL